MRVDDRLARLLLMISKRLEQLGRLDPALFDALFLSEGQNDPEDAVANRAVKILDPRRDWPTRTDYAIVAENDVGPALLALFRLFRRVFKTL
jgi:hypothetical protein